MIRDEKVSFGEDKKRKKKEAKNCRRKIQGVSKKTEFCQIKHFHILLVHCLQKGPQFKDLVKNKDLFGILGPYLYFRVLVFTSQASFTQRILIQSACIQQWFWFKLLANFDFYLCLRINFHTSSFWVLILAALGPLLGP